MEHYHSKPQGRIYSTNAKLCQIGVFSEEDYNSFISSLTTVSGQLSKDWATMDKSSFLGKYGHLRPEHTTSHQNDMMKLQIFTLIGKAKTKKLIKHNLLYITTNEKYIPRARVS